ncbi:class I SAM-dependent methyltransferase [Krasilnikoviella flava]|uniref:Putative zinc binding domain-containing protein n=1 Tax=Krasilnikoviella flava TaxID=526729 RepID=A0A1T5IEU1_9MICO|nr:class I SAM-dependent methyltransferase [Krasilnikoviella flava]SKC37542.1 Putative zinc binding domain-containing protein [Krasilnikoviella flava]
MSAVVPGWRCRWCRSDRGTVVLDLGAQPASDLFPEPEAPAPDPVHPLRMVMCDRCRLAQLEEDPTGPEVPRGVEPAALVAQARAGVADLVAGGLLGPGTWAAEMRSPHGGSWLERVQEIVPDAVLLDGHGTVPGLAADLVVDSLGLMHEADQRAAWDLRLDSLAPDGVLALHVHPLSVIVRDGTWNALRHGHFAYYSLTVLVEMARSTGLVPVGLWRYPLYGGTRLLALAREGSEPARAHAGSAGELVATELAAEAAAGATEPRAVAVLQRQVARSAAALRDWLDESTGKVVAYGAASRAVALFALAGVTADDVLAVVDASPAKRGRAMPGGPGPRVPVLGADILAEVRPDKVLLLVPDLLDEVRSAHPEVEGLGGRWVVAEPEPVEVEPLSRDRGRRR